jgi:hypothetical protein
VYDVLNEELPTEAMPSVGRDARLLISMLLTLQHVLL